MASLSSTSGLVKITSARNASGIVHYNMKTNKTQGKWSQNSKLVTQRDLVGFYGTASHPGLPLRQQGNLFALQTNNNARMANIYNNNSRHRLMYDNLPNRLSTCHTIVQSFDYKANPKLKPRQVHYMGEQLLIGVKNYLQSRYNYKLDSGMISTHIDDDRNRVILGHKHYKHLHNHIVIMSYNDSGQSISPFLRKQDLYCFKRINDLVASRNGLKDYYFLKLEREVKPNSSFTKSRAKHTKSTSNLQKAVSRFAEANDAAFDLDPKNFRKAHRYRNRELTYRYGYKNRNKKDTRTHQERRQFTMDAFTKRNHQSQWYNMNNLRLLVWRNKKDAKCERLIRQFNFNLVRRKPVSYDTYLASLRNGFIKLPTVQKLDSKQKRQKNKVILHIRPQKSSQKNNSSYQSFADYLDQLHSEQKWRQQSHNPYNKHTHDLNDDFIVQDFSKLANEIEKNKVNNTSTTNNNHGNRINRQHKNKHITPRYRGNEPQR